MFKILKGRKIRPFANHMIVKLKKTEKNKRIP